MIRLIASIVLASVLGFIPFDQARASCAIARGRPKAECNGWVVFNTAALYRIAADGQRRGKEKVFATGDIGYMRNVRDRDAVGGSLYVGWDGDGARFGALARYRRFLTDRVGLDLNVGGTLGFLGRSTNEPGGTALVVQTAVSGGDWVSLLLHMQVMNYKVYDYRTGIFPPPSESRTATEYYAGLRFGSFATPAVLPFLLGYGIYVIANLD